MTCRSLAVLALAAALAALSHPAPAAPTVGGPQWRPVVTICLPGTDCLELVGERGPYATQRDCAVRLMTMHRVAISRAPPGSMVVAACRRVVEGRAAWRLCDPDHSRAIALCPGSHERRYCSFCFVMLNHTSNGLVLAVADNRPPGFLRACHIVRQVPCGDVRLLNLTVSSVLKHESPLIRSRCNHG